MSLTCETCPNLIERTGKRGPAPRFCDSCKGERKRTRQRANYVKKGPAKERPGARKYTEGWTSANGQLTLVRRIVGDKGRAWFECACGGVAKVLHIKNVRTGLTQNCAERDWHADPRAGRFKGEHAAYATVHHWVARVKGSASSHSCHGCGAPAEQWAYMHGTADVKADAEGKDAGSPFAPDVEQYEPMCRRCHKAWDRAKGKGAGHGLSLAHIARWAATHDDDSNGSEVAA
ncbi:hypothetical protein [Streptomyces coerulescens]|uniref:HNH endonuclease n=1 Tax=Streptomyces coerulescens TaxID=29304 RepID=A0ABW0CK26_STRCD